MNFGGSDFRPFESDEDVLAYHSRKASRAAMRARKWGAQAGRCAYCRAPMKWAASRRHGNARLTKLCMTEDHVHPTGRGGQNVESNIVLSCHWCNARKGMMTGAEWVAVLWEEKDMGARETPLMKEILVALWREFPDGLWYRRNVGSARAGDRFVRFGMAGQADIPGILDGRAIEVEVKPDTGRQSQDQKHWQAAVERAGGVYLLVRSVDDAIDGVRKAVGR